MALCYNLVNPFHCHAGPSYDLLVLALFRHRKSWPFVMFGLVDRLSEKMYNDKLVLSSLESVQKLAEATGIEPVNAYQHNRSKDDRAYQMLNASISF